MENPYLRSPAEGDDFVGRIQDYQRLQQVLEKNPSIIIVTGERGIGKTSFLRNLLRKKFERTLFIEYRTEKGFEKGFVIPDLYKRLRNQSKIKEIMSVIKRLDNLRISLRISESPSLEIEKPSGALTTQDMTIYETMKEIKDFLKKIKEKIVVIVENAHNLSPKEQRTFDMLVRSPNFFVILEVPTVEMDKIVIRDYNLIDLGRLSREESLEIIGRGKFLSEEISENVYKVSEGNPYYIQNICWLLYEKRVSGDTIGMSSFVNTLREKELRDRQDFIHREILMILDENSKNLVMDLSIAPVLLTHKIIRVFSDVGDLDGALSSLVRKEILLEKNELFWIYHSLFREFLRNEQKNTVAIALESIYVKAAGELKRENDCILLLYELKGSDILLKVVPQIENEGILLKFGNEEFGFGRWETAQLCFERGFELDGEFRPHFVGSLGSIFHSRGKGEDALRYYREALDIHRQTL